VGVDLWLWSDFAVFGVKSYVISCECKNCGVWFIVFDSILIGDGEFVVRSMVIFFEDFEWISVFWD
jgi:hypothetical protein